MMDGWTKIEFSKIGSKFFSGGTPSTKNDSLWNGNIPWITSKWLGEPLFLFNGEKKISQKGLDSSASKLVKSRSIIIATRVGVGKVAINNIDIAINQDLLGVEIDEENYSLEFLVYQLRSQEVQNFIHSFKRGATIQGVTRDAITSIKFNIPPLPEQRKIAYILSTMQKAIEQQDKLIRATTELKKALMQKLFTEGTKGEKQKETEIGWVPESWEEIVIGDLGKCVTGTTPKTAIDEFWNSDDYDFIAPADIGKAKYVYNSEKKMSEAGLGVSRILPKNSVLCVCIGSSIGKVGMSFKEQSSTNQQINSIICNEKYIPFYTYFLLSFYAEHWRSHATFGPVPILNKGQFEIIKIYASHDPDEQNFIAESLNALDLKIEFHEKKKGVFNNLFKSLLHELMTGQRRVHEIEFETLKKEYKIEEQPLSMAAEQ